MLIRNTAVIYASLGVMKADHYLLDAWPDADKETACNCPGS